MSSTSLGLAKVLVLPLTFGLRSEVEATEGGVAYPGGGVGVTYISCIDPLGGLLYLVRGS